MAENLSHGDLVAKIAMNSRLTAREVEEALDVLSSIIQDTLQHGGKVELLGIGNFSSGQGTVSFDVGASLRSIVADPSVPVSLQKSALLSKADLGGLIAGQHKVNVC